MAGGMSFDTIDLLGCLQTPANGRGARTFMLSSSSRQGTLGKEQDSNVVVLPGTVKPARSRSDFGDLSGCSQGRLYKSRRQLKAQLMPLYAEMNYAVSVKHRRNTMVKVTIADVLQEEHNGTQVYVVVLLDEAGLSG